MTESDDPRFGPVVPGAVPATGGAHRTPNAAAGAAPVAEAQQAQFATEADTHYRSLYEASPESGRSYDAVRAAYVFGHVAASEPGLAGQTFEEAEPALREAWTDELRAQAGEWTAVRAYVHDAYGHARSDGAGARRDPSVIGSAGSAVDPVELDRARHELPSVGGGGAVDVVRTDS